MVDVLVGVGTSGGDQGTEVEVLVVPWIFFPFQFFQKSVPKAPKR